MLGEDFTRQIHNLNQSQFKAKFYDDYKSINGNKGIGVISDYDEQPIYLNARFGPFCIVTSGFIENAEVLAEKLLMRGISFSEVSNRAVNTPELIAKLINQGNDLINGIEKMFEAIEGSCSLLLLNRTGMYAARDRFGYTPLIIGKREDAWAVTSETSAFPNNGFEITKYIEPGLVWVGGRGFFLLYLWTMEIVYRKAVAEDLPAIAAFVDFWLTGGGKAGGIPGAGHDFFVPAGRHKAYLAKYDVLLAGFAGAIVGWAVKTKKGVLIHLLVAATFRGRGIGSEMLRRLRPVVVRSKFDQSSGDPSGFYRKHGYVKRTSERTGKKKNIDIFIKADSADKSDERSQAKGGEPPLEASAGVKDTSAHRRRSIDVIAEKLAAASFSLRRL